MTYKYLDQFATDQRELLLFRLGEEKILAIESRITDEVIDIPPMATGDQIRPEPRKSYSATRFYWACIREMGSLSQTPTKTRVPNPANAWMEVLNQRYEVGTPTFSHHSIPETINYFGGWQRMWTEFNTLQEPNARNRFIMAFKEIVE